MKITSGFMKGIVSKFITRTLSKKLGCDIDIQLNGLEATVIDGKTHIHLDTDIAIEKEELLKILQM